jgi:hypothetical protein
MTEAHDQTITHRYVIHYPEHPARKDDPNYRDFEAFRRRTKATARCQFAVETKDDSQCDHDHPLELHHSHIEFSLQNGVDLRLLEVRYPGVSDPATVGAWVESADNLEWLCVYHHRGPGGKHTAAVSDFEAEHFIRGLIHGTVDTTKENV